MSLARIAILSVMIALATSRAAEEPQELREARREYEASPSEAARIRFVIHLARLRDRLVREHKDGWQAVDAEVVRHPMASNVDSELLRKRVIGKWASPRHSYLYRPDGTWTMLPEFEDGIQSTHGIWRIERNQFVEGTSEADATRETIIVLTKPDFIFGRYYMKRGENYF